MWICPNCNHEMADEVTYCTNCRGGYNPSLGANTSSETLSPKRCSYCGQMNNPQNQVCEYCQKPFSIEQTSAETGMFANIGGKLKGLAKVVAILSIIFGVLLFVVGGIKYAADADYLKYAAINGGSHYSSLTKSGNSAYAGLQMLEAGIVLGIGGFFGSWPLYGIGKLVETNQQLLKKIEQIEQNTKKEND